MGKQEHIGRQPAAFDSGGDPFEDLGETDTVLGDDSRNDDFDDFDEPVLHLAGRVLDGKYKLTKLLGAGGMGAVYLAEHVAIGSRVAVKVLFTMGRRRKEALARFHREARAAGTIGHPNIVKVQDMGQSSDGIPYLVMELIEGSSLSDILREEAPLEPSRAVHIVEQVLGALQAAHDKGIIHRDIKPENVMISRDPEGREHAMVLDFGISKVRPTGDETSGLTRTGTVLGTPMYMSPEQARGAGDLDHRIDIYAVGTMLYYMLSGRVPYDGDNYNAIMIQVVTERPTPLAVLNPDLDPCLVAAVEQAMASDREERFSSARSFVAALRGEESSAYCLPSEDSLPSFAGFSRSPTDSQPSITSTDARHTTVAIDPARSPRLPRWLLPVVGLAVVIAATVGVVLARSAPDSASPTPEAQVASIGSLVADAAPEKATPAPTPTAEIPTIAVKITTEPRDAKVFVAGVVVGDPADHELIRTENEKVLIRVEAEGYLPSEREFPRDEDIEEHIVLKRRLSPGGRGRKRGNFRDEIR